MNPQNIFHMKIWLCEYFGEKNHHAKQKRFECISSYSHQTLTAEIIEMGGLSQTVGFIIIFRKHYRDVTWASWCLKSKAIRLLVQQLILTNNRESIKVPQNLPFAIGIHGWPLVSLTKDRQCRKLFHAMTSLWTRWVDIGPKGDFKRIDPQIHCWNIPWISIVHTYVNKCYSSYKICVWNSKNEKNLSYKSSHKNTTKKHMSIEYHIWVQGWF